MSVLSGGPKGQTGAAEKKRKEHGVKMKSCPPLHSDVITSIGQHGVLERRGQSIANAPELSAFGALVRVRMVETTAVHATRIGAGVRGGTILLCAHEAPSAVHRFEMAASTDMALEWLRAACSEMSISLTSHILLEV